MKTYNTEQAAHEVISKISLGYMLNGKDTPRFQIVQSCGKFLVRVITETSVYLW